MNDLQEAHWPSLQPCISMIPCSAAARRMVWSSLTSISMPTGSKRTTCLPDMTLLPGSAGREEAAESAGQPPPLVTG